MKIGELIFLLIPLFIAGCKSNGKQSASNNQADASLKETQALKKHAVVPDCSPAIINNEFSFDVLAFEVFKADATKIKTLFIDRVALNIEKQKGSESNSYDQYNFTDGTNKLSLYYNDGFYLDEGDIKNGKFLLNKKISIGMAKADFAALVKATNIQCDTVTILNDESSFETVYVFKDAKLKEIKMGQIVE